MSSARAPPKMSWMGKPECRKCKYYEKGTCRLFIEQFAKNEIMFAPVDVVRADEKLCGPKGLFWSSSDFDSDQTWYSGVPWTQE